MEVGKELLTYHMPTWKSWYQQSYGVNNSLSFSIETNAVFCAFINLNFKLFIGKDLLSTYYVHIVGLGDGSAKFIMNRAYFLLSTEITDSCWKQMGKKGN